MKLLSFPVLLLFLWPVLLLTVFCKKFLCLFQTSLLTRVTASSRLLKVPRFLFSECLFALSCHRELYRNFTNSHNPVSVAKQLPAAFSIKSDIIRTSRLDSLVWLCRQISLFHSYFLATCVIFNRTESYYTLLGAWPEAGHMTAPFNSNKASIFSICDRQIKA